MSLAPPDIPATLAKLRETPVFQALSKSAEPGELLSFGGVSQGAWGFLAAVLAQSAEGRPVVVVCPEGRLQERIHQELETWLPALAKRTAQPLLFFPAWDVLPHEARLPHADVLSERLETLLRLTKRRTAATGPVVVTTGVALLQRTFAREELKKRFRRFKLGQRIDPLDLVEWLEDQGYEPEAQVSQKGELALRGGILDVFPLASPWPVRFEFFGDEIESLRTFDPQTQLAREKIELTTISPGGELGLLKQQLATDPSCVSGRLSDYLDDDSIFLLIEPDEVAERVDDTLAQVPGGDRFHDDWKTALGQARKNGTIIEIRETGGSDDDSPFVSLDAYRPLGAASSDPQVADAQRREFFNQLHRWLRSGYTVWTLCGTEGELQRFEELWAEYGLAKRGAKPVRLLGSVSAGFLVEPAKLVVVTDSEIFGRTRTKQPRRLKSPHAAATRSALEIDFTDLSPGDFVVHLQHGIGRYLGLKVLPVGTRTTRNEGGGEECLVIEYGTRDPEQEPPKLYVPVSEAHLVSKYVGTGRARPPLSLLGGKRWAKAKADAEKAVEDLAADLLKLQAAREAQPGHAFCSDTPWQREFEGSFPFEETRDQWSAIEATKQDMERHKPMDRLVCGDVGFGKTEVAIRAAFKAVMDGKQVAVLVPTTVLAQQHYNTFLERMTQFPVSVELLSRFRSKKEADAVADALAAGSVDVVIGTHKLIQPSVRFRELGLVIIDEEQRFGVRHKEQLKMLRQTVDVLTLTATPIPRTLHMALTGARDMSTIETPPQDRLPIETTVIEFDEKTVRDAIQRELNRGGQVFFLHNRVTTIETMADRLRKLVPKARLIVGHGQIASGTLEKVMTRFVNGDADILLSTTIIESGVDIPNANTIIVDRADRFGLSELYQLRGRVGRYKHQAYAYLILPRHAALLADARKRISALKQYSKLGSGFKIAMRDLEIRGAGNLLGAQQSGHITAVGFELYCQLLKQSVKRLKGEAVGRRVEVRVTLDFLATNPGEEKRAERAPRKVAPPQLEVTVPREVVHEVEEEEEIQAATAEETRDIGRVPAYLPFNHIPEMRQRIILYRKLAGLSDATELAALKEEIRDRFGPIPKPVERLLRVAELKVLAAAKSVTGIEAKGDKIMLTRNGKLITLGGKFPRFNKRSPDGRLAELRTLLRTL
ncbi:MAG: transcription-repair coupling factor [Verrucomicrobiota bacterium]|nr:transcription-repair coupling factor [Verrucomicrobiota bacterium]MDP7049357.1 transcription-repair coupling factor [Verrucomicrobiota bacterium]